MSDPKLDGRHLFRRYREKLSQLATGDPPTLAALAVKPCFCIWELVLQRPEHSLGGPERHLVAADHVFQTDSLARCGGPPRQLQEFLGLVETHRNCPQPELRYSNGVSFFVTLTPHGIAIQGLIAP